MIAFLQDVLRSAVTTYVAAGLLAATIALELWLRFTPVAERKTPTLEAGERLLWVGAPIQGVVATLSDLRVAAFIIIWCAASASRFKGTLDDALRGRPSDPFAYFPVVIAGLFVTVGFYILVGRYFLDAHRRRGTSYALTSRCAVVMMGGNTYRFPISALRDPDSEIADSGVGSIAFSAPGNDPPTGGFDLIPDAQYVRDLISKTIAEMDETAMNAAADAVLARQHRA